MKHNDIYRAITTYISHKETFKIVKHEGTNNYLAINTKYLDCNGRATKELRGFEMFISEDIPTCIERIEAEFRKQEFEAQGYGQFAAIVLSHGGSVEEALEAEQRMQELLNK